jgi:DeoR/GlpR family transcriptional regulator of sugar metabolism
MGKKDTRITQLLNMLHSTGRVTTAEATDLLGISEATARRMFTELERDGKVLRDYGGVRPAAKTGDFPFELREKVFQQEKIRIGRLAASFVKDGDTIYLDCGTTLLQMALALSAMLCDGVFRSLNLVTNSIANVQAIAPSPFCRVILIGGEYNSKQRDFSGPLTEKFVSPLHFSKCFLGCDGLDAKMGFSSNLFSISSLNAAVMERSDKTFILLDKSKFGRRSLVSYAQTSEVPAVITDRAPEGELHTALADSGVIVHVAEE